VIRDQNRVIEAVQSFIGGANSSLDPALILPDQFSWGTNVRIRGGYPRTRPGFRYIGSLPGGKIQGALYYPSTTGDVIAFCVSGRLYTVNPAASSLVSNDITPVSGGNNPDLPFAYLVNAGGYLVVQDGQSSAIVYSGTNSYRSSGILEDVPTAVKVNGSMALNKLRLTLESTTGLYPGMLVSAARGVQPDTRIVSIDSTNTVTLDKATEVAAFAEFSFLAPGPLKQDISIPVGGPMVYGNGRLWVARGNELFAGDLVNSYKGAQIQFSEILYLTGGGAFAFDDTITALGILPGADTSTGQGDLVVFTKKSVNAIRSYIYDRQNWQNTVGMQRFVFDGVGEVAHESVLGTANDLYFRSKTGVMSFQQTLKEKTNAAVILSDSMEAARVLDTDTARWLQYANAAFFDSRYLLTAAPVVQRYDAQFGDGYNIAHRSLISADLAPASVKGKALDAGYDGEWTGLQISKMIVGTFNGDERCFALCCGTDGFNSLYEITRNDPADTDSSGNSVQITSGVEFRRMSFDRPAEIKELIRADIGFSDIYGPNVTPTATTPSPSFTWTFSFRPDYYPTFFTVQSDSVQIDTGNTDPITTDIPYNLRPGYLNVRTVKPSDSCVTVSGRLGRFGYLFQPKLEWTGTARLSLFRLHGNRKDISDLGEC
jgi:hypothetical protein